MAIFGPSPVSIPVLLFLFVNIAHHFSHVIARGGHSQSYDFSGRHLLENDQSKLSLNVSRGYMTNDELENAIMAFGEKCSNISRIYSIGRSVNGFPLWVMEISDNPGKEEPEPAFKFIGNVHGDEPVGRELLLRLANWLCDNYLKEPLATLIVENVHLHILPSMNPDGFALRRRGNANDIDLNRDFPDQFFDVNNDVEARQPEIKAIMKWSQRVRFTASASLHGGALVANYPWDGTQDKRKLYYSCPDDRTFRYLAAVYSRSHYNMSRSQEFPGGITNGALWYPIYGGMQDWNYIHAGCFELTLEISDNKWPKAEELPAIWEYNRKSMLNLAASVFKVGVHGRILSSDNGKPLPAYIIIEGINHTVKAGELFADYHRLLAPGVRYEVTASVPDYKSKSTVILLEKDATSVDFILDPERTVHKVVESGCDCNCDSTAGLDMVDVFVNPHLEVSLLIIVVIAFFFFLFKRKTIFSAPNQRQVGSKRPAVV